MPSNPRSVRPPVVAWSVLLGVAVVATSGLFAASPASSVFAWIAGGLAVVGGAVPVVASWVSYRRGDDWAVVFGAALSLPVLLAAGVGWTAVLPPDAASLLPTVTLIAAGWVYPWLALPAVYRERKRSPDGWTPSVLSYGLVFSGAFFVGPLVAIAYVYERHRRVGVP